MLHSPNIVSSLHRTKYNYIEIAPRSCFKLHYQLFVKQLASNKAVDTLGTYCAHVTFMLNQL